MLKDEFEEMSHLNCILNKVYESLCKVSHSPKKFHQPWWNPELKKLLNGEWILKAWTIVNKVLIPLKENVEKKRMDEILWRFGMHLDSVKYYHEFLMNNDNSFTESSNEILELLMTIHFPVCKDEELGTLN